MCTHAVKELHLLRCVPDRYKTQQMCDIFYKIFSKMVEH